MKIKILVAIESDDGKSEVVDQIACIERKDLKPGTMGMTLSEEHPERDPTDDGTPASSRFC